MERLQHPSLHQQRSQRPKKLKQMVWEPPVQQKLKTQKLQRGGQRQQRQRQVRLLRVRPLKKVTPLPLKHLVSEGRRQQQSKLVSKLVCLYCFIL